MQLKHYLYILNLGHFRNYDVESLLSLGDFKEELEKGTNKIFRFVCSLKINVQKLIYSIPIFTRTCFLRLMDPHMKIEVLLYACGFMFALACLLIF